MVHGGGHDRCPPPHAQIPRPTKAAVPARLMGTAKNEGPAPPRRAARAPRLTLRGGEKRDCTARLKTPPNVGKKPVRRLAWILLLDRTARHGKPPRERDVARVSSFFFSVLALARTVFDTISRVMISFLRASSVPSPAAAQSQSGSGGGGDYGGGGGPADGLALREQLGPRVRAAHPEGHAVVRDELQSEEVS